MKGISSHDAKSDFKKRFQAGQRGTSADLLRQELMELSKSENQISEVNLLHSETVGELQVIFM